jgi:hypothetical protein
MDPTFKTIVDGELVELPATIATIRAALPAEQAEQFDAEVEHAGADRLPMVLAQWALRGTGADQEDAELFRLLEAGEDVGAVEADDDAARGAA